jgi:putative nucleotidyltransferase with HDIG domain
VNRRILFVHDDPATLCALEEALRHGRGEWVVETAGTTADALDRLAASPFAAVVADVGRRNLGGGSFLDEVAARQPCAIRLLLSTSGGRAMLMRAGGAAHQHLSSPVDLEAAFERLESTFALGELLLDSSLQGVVGRLRAVPSLPSVYVAIMAELRQQEPSGARVGELVAKDAGMSAKLLQLVNSPFFGLRMPVKDPSLAVQLLGLETLRALVLSMHIFEQFDDRSIRQFRLGRVWRHSLSAAHCARLVARWHDNSAEVVGEATTAALLHDIGKLILATSLEDEYGRALARAEQDRIPQWEAEREIIGATHAEVGAYLLGLWGLPETIVEATAWHHRPSACPSSRFSPLGVVHVADAIEHEVHPADLVGAAPALDDTHMERFRAVWQYAAWKAAYLDAEGEGLGRGLAAKL